MKEKDIRNREVLEKAMVWLAIGTAAAFILPASIIVQGITWIWNLAEKQYKKIRGWKLAV